MHVFGALMLAVAASLVGCTNPAPDDANRSSLGVSQNPFEKECTPNGEFVRDATVQSAIVRSLRPADYVSSRVYEESASTATLRHEDLAAWRNELLAKWFRAFLGDYPQLWLNQAGVVGYLSDPTEWAHQLNDGRSVLSRFIVLQTQEAGLDCRDRPPVYRYTARFWVTNRLLTGLPEELRSCMNAVTEDDLLAQMASGATDLERTYRALRLSQCRTVAQRLEPREQWQRFIGVLGSEERYLFAPLFGFPEASPVFPPGVYQLSSVMASLIDQYAALVARDHRSRSLLVLGYSDSSPVRGTIQYAGHADLDLSTLLPAPYLANAPTVSRSITNNRQLSIARAHEGAAALSDALDQAMVAEARRSVSIRYAGGGAIPGPPHAANRRIVIMGQ